MCLPQHPISVSAGSALYCQLCLHLLNSVPKWQTEKEQRRRLSITRSREGAGLWRGALIGSDDPEQPLRAGWHRVCAVNYTSPSEHRGSEDGGAAWGRAQVAVERSAAYGCSQPHTGGYVWRYLLTYWTGSLHLTTGKYWQGGNGDATLDVTRQTSNYYANTIWGD